MRVYFEVNGWEYDQELNIDIIPNIGDFVEMRNEDFADLFSRQGYGIEGNRYSNVGIVKSRCLRNDEDGFYWEVSINVIMDRFDTSTRHYK